MLISRPITPEEEIHLASLGRRIKQLRIRAGMTRLDVSVETGLNPQTIYRIERGLRRTRQRTLRVITSAISDQPDALAVELVKLAGPALAPESAWAGRIEQRRLRRIRRHEVLQQREEYRVERDAQEAEWRRRTESHLEFRAAIRFFSRSFDWLYKRGYFDERPRKPIC